MWSKPACKEPYPNASNTNGFNTNASNASGFNDRKGRARTDTATIGTTTTTGTAIATATSSATKGATSISARPFLQNLWKTIDCEVPPLSVPPSVPPSATQQSLSLLEPEQSVCPSIETKYTIVRNTPPQSSLFFENSFCHECGLYPLILLSFDPAPVPPSVSDKKNDPDRKKWCVRCGVAKSAVVLDMSLLDGFYAIPYDANQDHSLNQSLHQSSNQQSKTSIGNDPETQEHKIFQLALSVWQEIQKREPSHIVYSPTVLDQILYNCGYVYGRHDPSTLVFKLETFLQHKHKHEPEYVCKWAHPWVGTIPQLRVLDECTNFNVDPSTSLVCVSKTPDFKTQDLKMQDFKTQDLKMQDSWHNLWSQDPEIEALEPDWLLAGVHQSERYHACPHMHQIKSKPLESNCCFSRLI